MRFLAFLLLVAPILHQADFQGYLPQVSPFFFLCNYHGNVQELGINNGEVRISVAIEGNPDNYVPTNFYKITVTSSLNFDAFLLTGLYTIPEAAAKQVRLIGIQAYQPVGLNLMCSIVHSHISMQPVHHFSFIWIAPPSGTGCVSFLATATLGQQILFKDITVLQMCEFGAPTQAPLRPALAEADSDHVIFRDDFDSSNSFAPELWSLHDGATVSDQCGTVMFGKSAVFCEKSGVRSLETQPLNTTSAHALSFALSAGTCGSDRIGDQDIVVSVALNGCTEWHELDRIRSPTKNFPEIHLVHLPPEARNAGVCFAWKQAPTLAPSIVYIESQSSVSPPLSTTTKRSTQRYTTQKYTTQTYTTPKPILTKTTKRSTQRYTTQRYTTQKHTTQIHTTQRHTTPEPTTLKLFTDHSDDDAISTFLPTSAVDYDYPSYGDVILHDGKEKPHGDEPLLTSQFGGAKKSATKTGRKFADIIKTGVKKTTVDGNKVEPGGDEREEPSGTYQNCWAVDNVLIVNLAHTPSKLEDNFDPMDPSEWTFFPGAQIKQKCHSEKNAMVFDNEPWLNGAVTRPVNLTVNDYQMDIIMEQQFESKSETGWVVEKGHVDVTCGIIHSGNSVVFDGPGKARRLCTPYMDTRKAGNVRFHFGFGSGKCHATDSEKTEVLVFVEDANDHTLYIIEKLRQSAYKEPRMVSLPLQPLDRQLRARICWLQKYNGGTGQDVWAIDNVQVLPHLPSSRAPAKSQDKTIQFSINMNCGNNPKENEVSVEYSNNLGGSWYKLHGSCLPGQCEGEHFPTSSELQTKDYSSWQRVTLPIPYAAQTPYVWFRIKQSSQDKPTWALDNVYIGDCPKGCNNHGKCEDGHCICDFGYQGPFCKESVVPNPTTLMENFEGQTLVTSSVIKEVQGAELSYDCDVLSMGKALVFNQDGQRMILTAEINTTNNMYLQYNIRVGSNSPVSRCPAPDHSSEVVVLDYSCNGGMTWKLLKVFSILDYRKAKSESVMLPNDAQDTNCQFRWWQPVHSGQGHDVWALDDLSLNNHLFNTLNLEMGKMVELGEKLSVTHGKLTDSYCRKMKSLSFLGEPKEGDERSFMTESMLIGPSYIMQFDLVMGCGLPYSSGKDNKLYLEYSKDHGIHWNLVEEPCLPPLACNVIQPGTVYEASQYPKWTRITIPLPSTTWGLGTRFRIRQSQWGPTDTWAVARLYIGQQCPSMCFGHGECVEGRCVCDEGFYGDSCQAGQPLDNSIQADFGIRYEPETDFLHVRGGKVVNSNEGCGTILSGESLYFFENGVRELQTKDMDTTSADVIQFYIKIGGQDKDCNGGDQRSEGVLLQYSNDGGITWHLLEELVHDQYQQPKFVKVDLPPEARSRNTRFRWWQPSHSGKGHDQWSVDEIQIGRYENLRSLEDNFDNSADPQDSGVWSITSDGVIGKYCQSGNPTLILANQEADKIVMTKDLRLQPGDIIQFKINVGCNNQFRWDHPVMFQYIQPGSDGWKLVHEPCYQEMDCEGKNSEGTIYYSGPYGHWELVVIPVPEGIISQSVMFRWWQPGGYPYSFALDDVYIGPSCKDNCNRHGVCRQELCACDHDFTGPSCQSDDPTPYGMVDRFEQHHRPSDFWKRILGGDLGVGCGTVDSGNGLYFDGEGTREAVTVPLNTAHLRVLQFVVKIGSKINQKGCSQPESRNEGIIVDFSTDNEVTWEVLKMVEPQLHNGTTEVVSLELPPKAKNMSTIFRWWQPLGYGGMPRAEWGLDSVIIGVNDTNLDGFQDDFSGFMPDMFTWFQTESAVPRITCNSKGNALEFSRNGGSAFILDITVEPVLRDHLICQQIMVSQDRWSFITGQRYAETWDYHVTPSTFLQFDIAMGCDSLYGTLYSVMLEYSVDMGKTWHPVVSECKPPNFECSGYHLSSMYMSDQYRNWTRISVYLPPGAVSPATRFRWHQQGSSPSGNVWALDNVYLGDGCPWLCSGHGYCKNGRCVCDEGFGGEYCVPEKPLPMMLRDDFNREKPQSDDWGEIYGGDTTDKCGHLVSGNALTFHEDHLRMAVTRDIDTSMLNTIEFYFLYGCNGGDLNWPRKESVLLQYSKNGGITWNLLKELHYRNESGPRFFSLELPVKAKYNATRFRFWQPANSGKMLSTWAIDNLFIGRMPMNPSMMEDEFETDKLSDSWLFVNDGEKGSYCESNTREDTVFSGESALVFHQGFEKGEHYVVTRDLDVGPMSVLQFDINVGCASDPTAKYPVRLEYSADGGKTWALVVPNCATISTALCHDTKLHSSIYYGGTSKYWRRIIIPLDHIYMCGSLRFRWYQGFIPSDDYGPEWAIDNVFIGMACMEHCLGQGSCQSTMMCECDPGHHGDKCIPSQQNSNYLKEAFTLVDEIIPQSPRDELPVLDTFSHASHDLDEKQWEIWSGGVISGKCGTLVSGTSLYFGQSGERMLVTKELDLSKGSTVQFWLRLGCQKTPPDPANPPVFLQYTTNGGVAWNTIEQFDFNSKSNKPFYAVLHLPEAARSNATQLRWWQPSTNGSFAENWALDQIYIGGDVDGTVMLSDEPQSPLDPNWLLWPGGTVEPVCGSIENAIHFNDDEKNRYAVSADVVVEEGTFLQFDIALGCEKSKSCYGVHLEFSLDMGTTWKPVYTECLPSDVACTSFHSSSILMSDVYTGWNRVTIPLPYYTRSKDTRFRWQQKEGFNPKDTWAVANLYIGKNCHGMCHGHGRCTVGGCLCDSSWQGEDCSIPVSPLPKYLYDTFNDGVNLTQWSKVMGAKVTKVCKVMPSGQALHFAEDCTRMLVSTDLDLREAVFVQFYFLYGCNSSPVNNDQNVVVDFSSDGGITWHPITQMYYQNYRSPAFITVKLPQEVKENGVRLRWWQPTHGKNQLHDWAVDNINIGGNIINPENFSSIPEPGFDPTRWYSADNLVVGEYCKSSLVAKGDTLDHEASTLTTRDLNIKEGYMLQFSYNIGCMHSWNSTVAPLYLQYSTDYGNTWSYVVRQCLSNDPRCKDGATMASVFYGDPMGRWQRVTIPLEKMVISSATRFRWQQLPYEVSEKKDFNKEANYSKSAKKEVVSDWAVKDIYIGPRCEDMCQGHGVCRFPDCVCDEGYSGQPCRAWIIDNPRELKDTFDEPGIDKSKWQLVQGGEIQAPCTPLVEGTALVMNGPGMRQIVTTDMDLRDAKFIQYHASLGGSGKQPGCIVPTSRDQDVILQYSTNGGITWHSLHTLDHTSYHESPKHDYILLPQDARTASTRIRWWQPLTDTSQPQWALDNVYIGGHEINPSQYQIGFNETQMISDQPWEFHPFGQIETQFCLKDDKIMYWEEGKGPRQFITKQMIVQTGYIIQFKIAVGCRQHYNACVPVAPIRLEFNNVPNSERWDLVQPLCLPDHNMRMDCRPNIYHHSSIYTPDSHPIWTRVTLELPEKTYSSGTRFRLIQESLDKPAPAWALDDVYVGENCPSFCHGRGDCKNGVCVCDKGYGGKDCMPLKQELVRMLESFEGGIFPSHWTRVSGGGIGFGCGALLPFAHGKTLYFNGCGLREAKTVPMDLSRASKVMFVIQIGCHAQTPDCNVVVGNASQYRGVLLQYSTNNDAEWHLIARHDPADYLSPKRLAYDLPAGARSKGTQLRWWQPVHDGEGTDQWALDNVEIIPGRNGINMNRFHNKREAIAGR